MNETDRIDKLISQKFNISRQEADFLISTSKVYIGKRKILKSHSKISLKELEKMNLSQEDIHKIIKENEDNVNIQEEVNENINDKLNKAKKEFDLLKENIEIKYEDEDILVINKPKGLVVYSGVGKEEFTVVNLLKDKYPLSNLYGDERLGIVHRLDKDTSGLLLIAKNNEAHKYYEKLFKDRLIKKEYIALVRGNIQETKGKIDMPIARSVSDFKKMEASLKGKEAITYFTVVERFKNYTLVKVNIETGRTHQIRVHFSQIAYPIVGDKKYSKGKNDFDVDSQLLHAYLLEFKNMKNEDIKVESEVPKEFDNIIKILRNRNK